MNYLELDSQLQGRNHSRRKLANNTYAHRGELNAIAIQLHATDILTFLPDGTIIADSGGWKTSTTKARLNEYLPQGYGISQHKGQWSWHRNGQDAKPIGPFPFTDGDKILPDGTLQPQRAGDTGEAKLRKSILKYAKLCADAIPLAHPGPGDCWHCHLQTQDGESLGDATKNTDHILSHIEEGYVVPSLCYHAAKEAGLTDLIIGAIFNEAGYLGGIAKHRLKKAVANYIYRRLGLVANGGWGNKPERAGFAVR